MVETRASGGGGGPRLPRERGCLCDPHDRARHPLGYSGDRLLTTVDPDPETLVHLLGLNAATCTHWGVGRRREQGRGGQKGDLGDLRGGV